MSKLMIIAAAFAATLAGVSTSTAEVYPSRLITMVVPFAAGGATDVIARIVAERMGVSLGQPIIIENVGGASGTIGVGRVARATPDGYMLDLGQWDTHVANGAIYALRYDLLNDFEPVALIASNPLLIVARKDLPAADLKSLVAWLKANPDKASWGHPSAAGIVGGIVFQKETGTRFQFVPYRGLQPAMNDLIAGHIDLMSPGPSIALPQVRAGAIRAYAVTAKSRLAAAPDIPTVDEAGLPGLHISGWFGLFAPKGTPKDVIAKLNAAVVDALADPTVRRRLTELGEEIPSREQQTPEALRAYQKAEIEKWWPIIKAANIKVE